KEPDVQWLLLFCPQQDFSVVKTKLRKLRHLGGQLLLKLREMFAVTSNRLLPLGIGSQCLRLVPRVETPVELGCEEQHLLVRGHVCLPFRKKYALPAVWDRADNAARNSAQHSGEARSASSGRWHFARCRVPRAMFAACCGPHTTTSPPCFRKISA